MAKYNLQHLIVFNNAYVQFTHKIYVFLTSIFLVWPFYATALSLREKRGFLTAKWLGIYNALFIIIVVGFFVWRSANDPYEFFYFYRCFLLCQY